MPAPDGGLAARIDRVARIVLKTTRRKDLDKATVVSELEDVLPRMPEADWRQYLDRTYLIDQDLLKKLQEKRRARVSLNGTPSSVRSEIVAPSSNGHRRVETPSARPQSRSTPVRSIPAVSSGTEEAPQTIEITSDRENSAPIIDSIRKPPIVQNTVPSQPSPAPSVGTRPRAVVSSPAQTTAPVLAPAAARSVTAPPAAAAAPRQYATTPLPMPQGAAPASDSGHIPRAPLFSTLPQQLPGGTPSCEMPVSQVLKLLNPANQPLQPVNQHSIWLWNRLISDGRDPRDPVQTLAVYELLMGHLKAQTAAQRGAQQQLGDQPVIQMQQQQQQLGVQHIEQMQPFEHTASPAVNAAAQRRDERVAESQQLAQTRQEHQAQVRQQQMLEQQQLDAQQQRQALEAQQQQELQRLIDAQRRDNEHMEQQRWQEEQRRVEEQRQLQQRQHDEQRRGEDQRLIQQRQLEDRRRQEMRREELRQQQAMLAQQQQRAREEQWQAQRIASQQRYRESLARTMSAIAPLQQQQMIDYNLHPSQMQATPGTHVYMSTVRLDGFGRPLPEQSTFPMPNQAMMMPAHGPQVHTVSRAVHDALSSPADEQNASSQRNSLVGGQTAQILLAPSSVSHHSPGVNGNSGLVPSTQQQKQPQTSTAHAGAVNGRVAAPLGGVPMRAVAPPASTHGPVGSPFIDSRHLVQAPNASMSGVPPRILHPQPGASPASQQWPHRMPGAPVTSAEHAQIGGQGAHLLPAQGQWSTLSQQMPVHAGMNGPTPTTAPSGNLPEDMQRRKELWSLARPHYCARAVLLAAGHLKEDRLNEQLLPVQSIMPEVWDSNIYNIVDPPRGPRGTPALRPPPARKNPAIQQAINEAWSHVAAQAAAPVLTAPPPPPVLARTPSQASAKTSEPLPSEAPVVKLQSQDVPVGTVIEGEQPSSRPWTVAKVDPLENAIFRRVSEALNVHAEESKRRLDIEKPKTEKTPAALIALDSKPPIKPLKILARVLVPRAKTAINTEDRSMDELAELKRIEQQRAAECAELDVSLKITSQTVPAKRMTVARFPGYRCQWARCSTVLHSADVLQRHCFRVHPMADAAGTYRCYWAECADEFRASDVASWRQHIQTEHLAHVSPEFSARRVGRPPGSITVAGRKRDEDEDDGLGMSDALTRVVHRDRIAGWSDSLDLSAGLISLGTRAGKCVLLPRNQTRTPAASSIVTHPLAQVVTAPSPSPAIKVEVAKAPVAAAVTNRAPERAPVPMAVPAPAPAREPSPESISDSDAEQPRAFHFEPILIDDD